MKNFLVVGGSSGIGLSLVKKLTTAGHHVWVMSRSNESLIGLSNIHHITTNVLEEVGKEGLPDVLDGVVYCPGSINLRPFRSLKPEAFRDDFEINVVGAVKVMRAALSALKKSDMASVVFFSTVAVGQGMPFHASVAAAKGAIEGLTRSLAAELAPKIRVNCIAPSLTDTPMAERLLSTDEKKKASGDRHPLKRVGTAEEVAALAEFLLMDNSTWMTGQILGLDGGMSALKV